MNVNPITGAVVGPIILDRETFFTLCRYHAVRDIKEWFGRSAAMKSVPTNRRKYWMRLLLTMEMILLNSTTLVGIGALLKLSKLLALFVGLLELPSTFSVPGVYLCGHLNVRVPTADELLLRPNIVAVGVFLCEASGAHVEFFFYERHVVNTSSASAYAADEDDDDNECEVGCDSVVGAAVLEAMSTNLSTAISTENPIEPDDVEQEHGSDEEKTSEDHVSVDVSSLYDPIRSLDQRLYELCLAAHRDGPFLQCGALSIAILTMILCLHILDISFYS